MSSPGDVLFEYVILGSTVQLSGFNSLLLAQGDIHGQEDRRRGVDGEGSADLVQLDALKDPFHILQGVHGDTRLSDLADGERIFSKDEADRFPTESVVDAETLRKAQARPEEYQNLIVRVAGYSDYFVDLGKDLQNEIIARTEQKAL